MDEDNIDLAVPKRLIDHFEPERILARCASTEANVRGCIRVIAQPPVRNVHLAINGNGALLSISYRCPGLCGTDVVIAADERSAGRVVAAAFLSFPKIQRVFELQASVHGQLLSHKGCHSRAELAEKQTIFEA